MLIFEIPSVYLTPYAPTYQTGFKNVSFLLPPYLFFKPYKVFELLTKNYFLNLTFLGSYKLSSKYILQTLLKLIFRLFKALFYKFGI